MISPLGRYPRRLRKPLPGISSGVLKTPSEFQPFYNDALGMAYDDTLTAAYVFNDSGGFGVDAALSGGLTGNDATAFFIDI